MRWRQADLNRRQAIGLIAAAAVAWPVRAHAADQWPARTVRLVVPALGSPTDVHGRIFAESDRKRVGLARSIRAIGLF